jgi:competence ComEA-like helix-hairpin-helix protein
MKSINRFIYVLFGGMLLVPLIAALAVPVQEQKGTQATTQELPPGKGKDLLVKECSGCHQLTVITSQHKSESGWTDTVVEMRNRGANGSDDDMEQIIRYLTDNFGPQGVPAKVNVNSASAADIVAGLALPQSEADAIVAYRNKNGKYKDVPALKQVPGVEAAKIDGVKDKIEF